MAENSKPAMEPVSLIARRRAITDIAFGELVSSFETQLASVICQRVMYRPAPLFEDVALLAACLNAAFDVVLVPAYFSETHLVECRQQLGPASLLSCDGTKIKVNVDSPRGHDAPGQPGRFIGLLTSGTTGTPKCARHTAQSLTRNIKIRPQLAGRRWLLAYPLAHIAGMRIFLQSLLNGGTLVVPEDFRPTTCREAILNHQVEYLSCTPTFIRQLLISTQPRDWERSALRHVTLGGEIVDQMTIDAVRHYFPAARVTHIYGTTELGEVFTVTDNRAGFDAKLIDHQHLKIETGVLYVKPSDTAMQGYLRDPGAFEEWIDTGDLVEVQGDRVYFLGRRDEVINVGGYNVCPQPIEQVIRATPGVLDALVFGEKSHLAGNLVKTQMVLQPGYALQDVKRQVIAACRERFPAHMLPRLFEEVAELNRTGSQKTTRARREQ